MVISIYIQPSQREYQKQKTKEKKRKKGRQKKRVVKNGKRNSSQAQSKPKGRQQAKAPSHSMAVANTNKKDRIFQTSNHNHFHCAWPTAQPYIESSTVPDMPSSTLVPSTLLRQSINSKSSTTAPKP